MHLATEAASLLVLGALDPKSPDYDKKDLMQAMFGLFISQTWDEGSIVNGFTGLADLTHFGVKHQTYWTLDDFKRSADMMNVSLAKHTLGQFLETCASAH